MLTLPAAPAPPRRTSPPSALGTGTGLAVTALLAWGLGNLYKGHTLASVTGLACLLCGSGALYCWSRRRWRTSVQEAQEETRRADLKLRDFFDRLPLGALLFDPQGSLRMHNRKAEEILEKDGATIEAVDWTNPSFPIIQADGNPLEPRDMPLNRALLTGKKVDGIIMGLEKVSDGSWIWVSATAEPRRDAKGHVREVLLTLEDVTAQRTVEAELAIQTFRDRLTGLPNRALFMERLTQAILRTERRKHSVAVLFLDLDRFKVINDSMSHDQGDLLLVQVSHRLRACLRPEDTVARLGGDEFVVLFEDLVHMNDGLRVAERIAQSFKEPFALESTEIFTTCSMGLALTSSMDASPAELVRDAEVAMYRAKAKGEGSIEVFDPSMNAQALARFQLESELRRGLDRNEFMLYYQPVIGLGTGRIEGWEALVRWRHPERGMVPPLDFIPLAEETGLIVPLGKWVLEEACRQASTWARKHPELPPHLMNVNISGRQFQQRELIATVTGALDRSRLEADRLKLEITESVMMRDPQASLEAMKVFKGLNIHLVIDDFGTGYSSLSYLKRFPVDTLKVDKSFVDGMGKDPESTAIVQAVISLAKSLGMRVTAEGIETREQMEQLKLLNCDQGQGYYFSRPLPAEAAGELLMNNPAW